MSFNNKFTGKVKVKGTGKSDLQGTVRIRFSVDLDSSVSVRRTSHSDIESSVNVKFNYSSDLPSSLLVPVNNDIPASVSVRPRNKMTGLVEVIEPPVIKATFNPVEDVYAREDMPKLNYGHDHDMFVGTTWSGYRYRSYLRFDISSLPKDKKIKRATLVLNLLNSLPSIPVGIYDIPLSERWSEYGLTWDSQPLAGTLIKTFDGGTYYGEIRVDITSYISEWYEGRRSHNGFLLKSLDESVLGRYKRYGTRESAFTPFLEIEYYDPTIYSVNRNDLGASVFIYGLRENDISASVVVNSYVGYNDLDASVTVRDPKIPVEENLPSSVYVTRDELLSTVFVYGVGENDLDGIVGVRQISSNDIEGVIIVNKPDVPSEVYVSPYLDLESSVKVSVPGISDFDSFVIVNAPEREGSVYVRPYYDIVGSVLPRFEQDLSIPSSLFVVSGFINAQVIVRQSLFEDVESSVTVPTTESSDIDGALTVRGVKESDLDSSVAVRVESYKEIAGSVLPRVVGASDISSLVKVEYASSIPATVAVRNWAWDDLESKLLIVSEGFADLDSSVLVRVEKFEDIDGVVSIRTEGRNDLNANIIVRVWAEKDISGKVVVRVSGASDLESVVEVDGDGGYAFIM